MGQPATTFDSRILELQSNLADVDGLIGLDEASFRAVYDSFAVATVADAKRLAMELLIVVRRYQDAGGAELSALITAQACVLLAVLLPGQPEIAQIMRARGLAVDARTQEAASLIGAAWAKTPVPGNVSAPGSLFNVMVARSKR